MHASRFTLPTGVRLARLMGLARAGLVAVADKSSALFVEGCRDVLGKPKK